MATINLSSHSVPEDAQASRPVGILSIEGGAEGETFTFTLADERFEIAEGDGGQYVIVVKVGASFDFETSPGHYMIDVRATGSLGTLVDDASFQIDVTDVNEAPIDIVVTGGSVGDNADLGTVVATLQGQDPDEGDELSYTFVTDATGTTTRDHDLFEIVDTEILVKGQLAVGTHSLWIKVTDSGNPALSYVKPITLTVTDANEAPEVVFEQGESSKEPQVAPSSAPLPSAIPMQEIGSTIALSKSATASSGPARCSGSTRAAMS
jgi:hypothetical protein